MSSYRARLAPSPTGFLHLGHARTFWIAQERARAQSGVLVLRNEDLDYARCKREFVSAMIQDLRWFGFEWQEGPDCGGPFGPYSQSERMDLYRSAFENLRRGGFVYPCTCSRQDVLRALQAPHLGEEEPIYPGTCRPRTRDELQGMSDRDAQVQSRGSSSQKAHYRFRLPDGEVISFLDGYSGRQQFIAGKDFGDFIVWRQDGIPAYQLAVVVDDAAMQITEVVRGEDLLMSTARQILLYRALGFELPKFFHCPLMKDEKGERLAKRHDALALRTLRAQAVNPQDLRKDWVGTGKTPVLPS